MDLHKYNINEYLDTLSEQIRCKKARPLVVEEIKNHIEDQAAAFERSGAVREDALARAVAEMGDPIQTGVELDKVHKPKMQWSIILMVVLLCLLGMIMQLVIFKVETPSDNGLPAVSGNYMIQTVLNTFISIAVMIGVCMLDYTFLGKHPVALWLILCISMLLIDVLCDGGMVWFTYYGVLRYKYCFTTLLVPLFAAVVFFCRNHKLSGLFKCIGFALLWPLCSGGISASTFVEYSLCILIILSAAVLKGWFVSNRSGINTTAKKGLQLAILWIPSVLLPVCIIISALCFGESTPFLADYQAARIRAMFGLLENSEATVSYTLFTTRDILSDVSFLGGGELPFENLPAIQNDYIVTCMFTYFGFAVTILILTLMAVFLFKAFHVSLRQKNQMGHIISLGCAGALLLKSVIYLCSNIGIAMPFTQMSMPFLSYGLSNAIINAVLVGLLLSVFRNTDIVSEKSIRPKYAFRSPIQKIE